MTIRRLWVGMETHDTDESGTDDRIVLIVNDNGIDRLHHTFPDTSQDDQERGAGNVYEVNVTANNIESIRLSNSSIRVGIRGKDAWCPKHFFAWGEQSQGGTVAPIAIETD